MIASMANFFFVESAIVLRSRMTQRVVMRMISLNQHAARQITAASSAGYLGYQLEGTFSSAKVRQGEAGVDRDDTDERDVRKIVPLGQHLCSHQEIYFALVEI